MPFTPYHFGWNALPGLTTRGRLDTCVLVAANIIIDTEVLADSYFAHGWPAHQLWHFHTLLVGGLAGMVFGAAVYYTKPFRLGCCKVNTLLGFSHIPTLPSMILSGIIGAWLHVLIDGMYHYDVEVFWPIHEHILYNWIHRAHWARTINIKTWFLGACVAGWILAGIFVVFRIRQIHLKKNK